MADTADSPVVESAQPSTAGAPHDQAEAKEGDNKFQKAISAWRAINLTSMVTTLDNTASEIVQYQRDSTVQRKDLAQKTKDFRKLEDPAKLGEVKGLLKAYQTFIDLLTNHSKATNSAFLQVYSSLSEAPDPYPLLEASVESLLFSEDTLPKVTQENQHLQESVSRLTRQLEEAEACLAAETSTRQELERSLENKVKEAEDSWADVLAEKSSNWEAKEKLLEEKVESQERLLSEIKASYEVNQRLGQAEDGAASTHVTSAELEMVTSDLERTTVRVAELEARNEQLRIELAQSTTKAATVTTIPLEEDPNYLRLRSENSALVRKLDAARIEKDAGKRDLEGRFRSLEREVGMLKDERDGLKSKVTLYQDYEEIKQELDILKSIEFSTGDDEETVYGADGSSSSKGESLERMLLARNKKLGDELTIMRVSHQDLQTRLQSMEEDMSKTNAELERARNLNASLENDLATVQESANAFPSGASVAGTYTSRYQPSTFNPKGRRMSPTSSIISGFDPRGPANVPSLDALRSGEPVGGGSGILPMITAQRDRFKKRNAQLEQELSDSHRTVSSLRQEVSSLQKDNLNLYEKTRYVSTYNRSGQTSSASAYNASPNPSTVQMATHHAAPALDRYRSAYESNLSPFAAFRGKESVRAYRGMSLPERIVFSITKVVLSSRTNRNLFAGYCLALHLMIFLSLYWMSAQDAHAGGYVVTSAVGGAGAGAGAGAAAVQALEDDALLD